MKHRPSTYNDIIDHTLTKLYHAHEKLVNQNWQVFAKYGIITGFLSGKILPPTFKPNIYWDSLGLFGKNKIVR